MSGRMHTGQKNTAQNGITGVLLAGGLGRRMGGVDKGLVMLAGRPMAGWVLQRLAPQVTQVVINANRSLPEWEALGYPVVSDEITDFAGPLAGLHAALKCAEHELVVTVPCDSPFLPEDLVARLSAALHEAQADLAVAKTGARAQPVFCLCRRGLIRHLEQYLHAGGRKIDHWHATLNVVEVAFEDETAFRNINTEAERTQAEQSFAAGGV